MGRRLVCHSFPPNVAFVRFRDIGEDAVLCESLDGVRVSIHTRARSDAKETSFRINRVELAVITKFHPTDVITNGFYGPSRDGRDQHGEIGLTACAWEGGCDIALSALRIGKFENEHVLGHPAFLTSHRGGNSKGETLLTQ